MLSRLWHSPQLETTTVLQLSSRQLSIPVAKGHHQPSPHKIFPCIPAGSQSCLEEPKIHWEDMGESTGYKLVPASPSLLPSWA